jgi:hypothetical protein
MLKEMPYRMGRLLPSQEDCALCNVRDRAEIGAIDATARRLEEHQARALNSLSAICLPHFVMLVSAMRNGDLARSVVERQATVFERYAEDVKRYAMKYDAVRRYLASQEETTAADRGLLLVTGRRQVNFVPRQMHPSRGDRRHTSSSSGPTEPLMSA